jgi:uncharacterized protein (TIGR00369 family)
LRNLPAIDHHQEVVERVGGGEDRVRLPFRDEYLGADVWQDTGQGVYSGPLVMALADTAMYACIHATLGRDIVAVIITMTITFLRPASAADLSAEARVVRQGKRQVYLEVTLYSDGVAELIAHATATYSVRDRIRK